MPAHELRLALGVAQELPDDVLVPLVRDGNGGGRLWHRDREPELQHDDQHREGEEGKLRGNALAFPHLHGLEYPESVGEEQSVGEETYVVL